MPHDLVLQTAGLGPEAAISPRSISVIGLGYVGAVSAACFAAMGHRVVGVDLDREKVGAIERGCSPIVETGLHELIARARLTGRLTGSSNLEEALLATDITFICVGTPSRACGEADLSALRSAASGVGQALGKKHAYHLVAVRSTVPATTTREIVLPILEDKSGLRCGNGFGVCFQPEFLREGVAVADFFAPPKTVVGGIDERSTETLAALYAGIEAPLIRTSLEVAEMLKYVDNTWHALKVAFANEVGRICHTLGADSQEVMGIFVRDTKLNLSPHYLRPGFAFGGSCLPKDVRSICSLARKHGLEAPLLQSILPSNDVQIRHALALIERSGARRIGFLGVTFKSGTDDLRESPQVELIARLLGEDLELRLHDTHVTAAGLSLATAHSAASSESTRVAIRVLPSLMVPTAVELVEWADIVVVAHDTSECAEALRSGGAKQVLDLACLPPDIRELPGYAGLCW